MAALSAATVQKPNEISSSVYSSSVPDRERRGRECVHVCVWGGVISSCISHHPQRKKSLEGEKTKARHGKNKTEERTKICMLKKSFKSLKNSFSVFFAALCFHVCLCVEYVCIAADRGQSTSAAVTPAHHLLLHPSSLSVCSFSITLFSPTSTRPNPSSPTSPSLLLSLAFLPRPPLVPWA